jgi:hypothetical protein
MIVRPEFYQPQEMRRADERVRLGLSPYLPTGIVMFGGYGSRRMISIARRVAEAGLRTQLIFMCGHNQDLRERLWSQSICRSPITLRDSRAKYLITCAFPIISSASPAPAVSVRHW